MDVDAGVDARSIAGARSRSTRSRSTASRDRRRRDRRCFQNTDRAVVFIKIPVPDRAPHPRPPRKVDRRRPGTARRRHRRHGDEGRAREEHVHRTQRERVVHDGVGADDVHHRRRRVRRGPAAGREQVGVRADGVFAVSGAWGEANERRVEGESKRDRERRAKGGANGDSRDATTKATGGANRNANANATPRARSSEVYEETTRGATGDDEGRIGRIGRIIRDD